MADTGTFEQLIANHGKTLARLKDSDGNIPETPEQVLEIVLELSDDFSNGLFGDLQEVGDDLSAAANYLDDAIHLPDSDPAKAVLLSRAHARLVDLDEYA